MLFEADIFIAFWIFEAFKYQDLYHKPVIFYQGFPLLHDHELFVGRISVDYFWKELWDRAMNCNIFHENNFDEHIFKTGKPNRCFLSAEASFISEITFYQTAIKIPSVRPLSLYLKSAPRYMPRSSDVEIKKRKQLLVLKRKKLATDSIFIHVANNFLAFSSKIKSDFTLVERDDHVAYDGYTDFDYGGYLTFRTMRSYAAVTLLPWGPHVTTFRELYNMNQILFVPSKNWLLKNSLKQYVFSESLANGQNWDWGEMYPNYNESTQTQHKFSPFRMQTCLACKNYWLKFTEYFQVPGVLFFDSLIDFTYKIHFYLGSDFQRMQIWDIVNENVLKTRKEAKFFWRIVIGALLD